MKGRSRGGEKWSAALAKCSSGFGVFGLTPPVGRCVCPLNDGYIYSTDDPAVVAVVVVFGDASRNTALCGQEAQNRVSRTLPTHDARKHYKQEFSLYRPPVSPPAPSLRASFRVHLLSVCFRAHLRAIGTRRRLVLVLELVLCLRG